MDRTVLASGKDSEHSAVLVMLRPGPNEEVSTSHFRLSGDTEVSFGRSRSSTIFLDRTGVSRQHSRLLCRDGSFVLEDCGSRNGTKLNGVRISTPAHLRAGDEFQIGDTSFILSVSTAGTVRRRIGDAGFLYERLAAELDRWTRYRRRFALYFLRLDGSMEEADRAVERLAGRMRAMDDLCEYSPRELVMLAPEVDETETQLAARLLSELSEVSEELGKRAQVGYALCPEDGTNADSLIERARIAAETASRGIPKRGAPSEDALTAVDDTVIVSNAMRKLMQMVERVAPSEITVLITGETGAGKEVAASAIHAASKRKSGAFLRLNCASLSENLLESELFGHERGAFTGADARKQGYFEVANGGTIFLDEIGEISPALQAKLLRVLENRTITRVGGTKEIAVDVRVLCATHRDLLADVQSDRFREDLYYRISAFELFVPSLRDRREDIVPLAEFFIDAAAKRHGKELPVLSAEARDKLCRHNWPGNVRELRNSVERAVVLAEDGVIEVDDLPQQVREVSLPGSTSIVVDQQLDVKSQLAELERESIVAALEACEGNQTKAAKRLRMSRRALIYKLEKYGLKKPPPSR